MSTDRAAVPMGRAGRRRFAAWLALCAAVGSAVIVYLALSLATSDDPLLMPLDDTYIHFQYARQMAQSDPFVYNAGDPATSGGTSLVYPLLLAVGYWLGFTGWSLAYWALGLGAGCLLGAAWLVYLVGRRDPLAAGDVDRHGEALLMALSFALAGPFIWAALSGMETALFLFVALLVFFAVQRDHLRLAVGAATLAALVRPEGLVLAAMTMVALVGRLPWPSDRWGRLRRGVWLSLPLLSGALQPAINWLATGAATSSGMAAKSHLYNTSIPLRERLADSVEFWWRMWRELLTGRSPDFGMFLPWPLVLAALLAVALGVWEAWRKRRVNSAVVASLWMLALTAAISTLDTAFWQFKRYQLPVMALLFPLAAWGLAALGDVLVGRTGRDWVRWILPGIVLLWSASTGLAFAHKYAENVRIVREQQVPMARWVRENLPQDARVGVHDVGLVRYFGERAVYDVVGLATPGPAEAWRQGPGAIYEHMARSAYRPDYFAIYPDVQGLTYLRDTGVFGEMLAEFPVDLGDQNVAAASDYQAVYRADWSNTCEVEQIAQTTTLDYVAGLDLVDWLDVGDLESESEHDYRWWQDEAPPGFVTEVYRLPYHACGLPDADDCLATDGGRVLTGGDEFTLRTRPGEDLLLVTRVHGRHTVSLVIEANGQPLAQRVQPAVPGRWVEIVSWLPAERVGRETRIRIVAEGGSAAYLPYHHWAYQGVFAPQVVEQEPVARFGADGAARLLAFEITPGQQAVTVALTWQGPAPGTGDGVVFVHLYNRDNLNTEPVAQVVERPAGGVLPPGNWLPGPVEDTHIVALPDDLAPGTYAVAVGLFDAMTGERYDVAADDLPVDDQRLFVGEITIEESAQ